MHLLNFLTPIVEDIHMEDPVQPGTVLEYPVPSG